ncbi:hypothetical protein D1007_09557 [Hordeum vulgare]|nr:hypothetical protein D1007_09557 [Hordeum vulgare]
MNPTTTGGSKHFHSSEETRAGSSAQPQWKSMKKIVSKKKSAKDPHDMSAKEFLAFPQHNPYCHPQDEALVGRSFWNKAQSLIYVGVLNKKTNLFVYVKSIDTGYMGSRPHTEYFSQAHALCL